MLPTEEVRRRIVAARVLLDISQDEMTQRGHDDYGLKKHELATVERGTRKLEPYHLQVLASVLEVPYAWFTEPREAIVSQRPPEHMLEELERLLGELRTRQAQAGTGR